MPNLHETRLGRKLLEKDVPDLVRAIVDMTHAMQSLSDSMDKMRDSPPLDGIEMRLGDMVDLMQSMERKLDD